MYLHLHEAIIKEADLRVKDRITLYCKFSKLRKRIILKSVTFYHDLGSCMNINIISFGDIIYLKISKNNFCLFPKSTS